MTALREAAQQALDALYRWHMTDGETAELMPAFEVLRAALAEPVQEPVALESVYETIIQWDEGGGKRSRRELARRIVDLHTAPPQRKPLTEGEMLNIIDDVLEGGSLVDVARAIERAHGIGGSNE